MTATTSAPRLIWRRAPSALGRRTLSTTSAPSASAAEAIRAPAASIIRVGHAGLEARAALDGHFRAQGDEFLDGLGGRRDARLRGIRFRGHSYQHETFPKTVDVWAVPPVLRLL